MAEEPGLQFDKAEFATDAPPKMACASCKRPIADAYYQLGQSVVCGACKLGIEKSLQGGSGFMRLLKATLLGCCSDSANCWNRK